MSDYGYKEYQKFKIEEAFWHLKDIISNGEFEGSKVEKASEEELRVLAEEVVHGLDNNDYLNSTFAQCLQDEISYQIREMFDSKGE